MECAGPFKVHAQVPLSGQQAAEEVFDYGGLQAESPTSTGDLVEIGSHLAGDVCTIQAWREQLIRRPDRVPRPLVCELTKVL